VVLCPPPTRPQDLSALAERIIAQIGEPFQLGRDSVTVGASVGIVHFDNHEDLDALLRDADSALYLAKAKGRSRWWMAPRE
jgi:GGDEF domain-containing protein